MECFVDFTKLSSGSLAKVAEHYGVVQEDERIEPEALAGRVKSFFAEEMSKVLQPDELETKEIEIDKDTDEKKENGVEKEPQPPVFIKSKKYAEVENVMAQNFFDYCDRNRCQLNKSHFSDSSNLSLLASAAEAQDSSEMIDRPSRKVADSSEDQASLLPGTIVTAKVNETWLLGRVVRYIASKKRYKVEDADELTDTPAVYDVEASVVIPLITADALEENDEESQALLTFGFSVGERVLGMFPGTSSFYPATVFIRFCDENGRLVRYGLQFEDDDKDIAGKITAREVDVLHVVKFR